MFAELVEELVGAPDEALEERLRSNKLELRRLTAERAALVAVSEHRGVFAAEHRSNGHSDAERAVVEAEQREIALLERYAAHVNYGFHVARRTD